MGLLAMGILSFVKSIFSASAMGDEIVAVQTRNYWSAKVRSPGAAPHNLLAQVWLARMAAHGLDPNEPEVRRRAVDETKLFACAPEGDNVRALGLYFVYKERPDIIQAFPRFEQSYNAIMGPILAANDEARAALYSRQNGPRDSLPITFPPPERSPSSAMIRVLAAQARGTGAQEQTQLILTAMSEAIRQRRFDEFDELCALERPNRPVTFAAAKSRDPRFLQRAVQAGANVYDPRVLSVPRARRWLETASPLPRPDDSWEGQLASLVLADNDIELKRYLDSVGAPLVDDSAFVLMLALMFGKMACARATVARLGRVPPSLHARARREGHFDLLRTTRWSVSRCARPSGDGPAAALARAGDSVGIARAIAAGEPIGPDSLLLAIVSRSLETVRALLRAGVRADRVIYGTEPIRLALALRSVELATELEKAGAAPPSRRQLRRFARVARFPGHLQAASVLEYVRRFKPGGRRSFDEWVTRVDNRCDRTTVVLLIEHHEEGCLRDLSRTFYPHAHVDSEREWEAKLQQMAIPHCPMEPGIAINFDAGLIARLGLIVEAERAGPMSLNDFFPAVS